MEKCFVIDSVGRSGALVFLWKVYMNVEIINFSQRHVNAWG